MYNDHPRDPKMVAVVDRWSFFRGYFCNRSSYVKMVVVINRWSLFGGGRQLRFDCILFYNSDHSYQVTDKPLVAHCRISVGHFVERILILICRSFLAKSGAAQGKDPVAKVECLRKSSNVLLIEINLNFSETRLLTNTRL